MKNFRQHSYDDNGAIVFGFLRLAVSEQGLENGAWRSIAVEIRRATTRGVPLYCSLRTSIPINSILLTFTHGLLDHRRAMF